jgi:hypothetical protein
MAPFLVQVDGLDVAIADSEPSARAHAEWLAAEDALAQVAVLVIWEGSTEVLPRVPAAEAVVAEDSPA